MEKIERYPFEVYMTAFHGGHFVSRHSTREAAEKKVRRERLTDCVCGCAGVVDTRVENPGTEADQRIFSDPYAIGMI